jgi:hypothetical protein
MLEQGGAEQSHATGLIAGEWHVITLYAFSSAEIQRFA